MTSTERIEKLSMTGNLAIDHGIMHEELKWNVNENETRFLINKLLPNQEIEQYMKLISILKMYRQNYTQISDKIMDIAINDMLTFYQQHPLQDKTSDRLGGTKPNHLFFASLIIIAASKCDISKQHLNKLNRNLFYKHALHERWKSIIRVLSTFIENTSLHLNRNRHIDRNHYGNRPLPLQEYFPNTYVCSHPECTQISANEIDHYHHMTTQHAIPQPAAEPRPVPSKANIKPKESTYPKILENGKCACTPRSTRNYSNKLTMEYQLLSRSRSDEVSIFVTGQVTSDKMIARLSCYEKGPITYPGTDNLGNLKTHYNNYSIYYMCILKHCLQKFGCKTIYSKHMRKEHPLVLPASSIRSIVPVPNTTKAILRHGKPFNALPTIKANGQNDYLETRNAIQKLVPSQESTKKDSKRKSILEKSYKRKIEPSKAISKLVKSPFDPSSIIISKKTKQITDMDPSSNSFKCSNKTGLNNFKSQNALNKHIKETHPKPIITGNVKNNLGTSHHPKRPQNSNLEKLSDSDEELKTHLTPSSPAQPEILSQLLQLSSDSNDKSDHTEANNEPLAFSNIPNNNTKSMASETTSTKQNLPQDQNEPINKLAISLDEGVPTESDMTNRGTNPIESKILSNLDQNTIKDGIEPSTSSSEKLRVQTQNHLEQAIYEATNLDPIILQPKQGTTTLTTTLQTSHNFIPSATNKEKSFSNADAYQCPIEECSRKFNDLRPAKRHIREIHFAQKFYCTECKASFARKLTARKHMNKEHNIKNMEPTNDTSNNQSMPIPIKLSTKFMCNLCEKTYATLYQQSQHVKNHCKLRCYFCPTKQKTIMDFDNNTDDFKKHKISCQDANAKPIIKLECTKCSKTFSNKSNLNSHDRKYHNK